jgi:hypothetical protein
MEYLYKIYASILIFFNNVIMFLLGHIPATNLGFLTKNHFVVSVESLYNNQDNKRIDGY